MAFVTFAVNPVDQPVKFPIGDAAITEDNGRLIRMFGHMPIYDIGNVHERNLPQLAGIFKTTRGIGITKFEFNKD